MPRKAKVTKNDNGERIAFVISPIGTPDSPERKRADQILEHVIEPVTSELGYGTIRADTIGKPGIITTQIINHIMNDSLLIADLTGHNPNVFYELAIRHAIRRPVIQIIKKGEKIPFDVSIQRTIEIDNKDLDSVAEAKKELKKQIKAVEKDPSLVDSPVSTAVNLEFVKQSSDPELKAIAEFRSTLQDINIAVKEIRDELKASRTGSLARFLPKTGTIRTESGEYYFPIDFPSTPVVTQEDLERARIDWQRVFNEMASRSPARKKKRRVKKK